MRLLKPWLILSVLLAVAGTGIAQSSLPTPYEDILQINGITMTSDSLRAVPAASILVVGKNRGVMSGDRGVFSIVVNRGDTLRFSALGFRDKEYVVPQNIRGPFVSLIQLMSQDTFYLSETIIRPLPTKENFDYAFLNWDIPNDQYEIARRNTETYTLRALAATLPKDGRENVQAYMNQRARESVYYGQRPPSNLFNPVAWMQFFDAWKRGDFRRKH
ncbi:MAG: carboxypeptidase-like regulatory domain-containing protein [Sphingobacteriales bacterium]|nr:MAG: carboxypeptidase-like regulatory domain-containing protein [Sphingobacteriales bacterium]